MEVGADEVGGMVGPGIVGKRVGEDEVGDADVGNVVGARVGETDGAVGAAATVCMKHLHPATYAV